MSDSLQLIVKSADETPEELLEITSELAEWIRDTAPDCLVSTPPPAPGAAGAKGLDIGAISTLVIAILNTGAVTAFATCLATYLKERRRSIQVELHGTDNQSFTLKGDSLGREEIKQLTALLGSMVQRQPQSAT